jgi:hypothetical protein
VRRSLVELTAAASCAVDDDVLMPIYPIGAAVADAPRPEEVANRPTRTAAARQVTVPRVAELANEPSSRPAALPDSDSTVEMLVQIAKDHQARALDSIRLGLGAALDYAKDLAKTPMPADRGPPDSGVKSEDKLLAAIEAGAAYRVEALELVKANVATTLDYTRKLVGATTAAEFVELSSALSRKQCELMLKQAAVLQSFARVVKQQSSENG